MNKQIKRPKAKIFSYLKGCGLTTKWFKMTRSYDETVSTWITIAKTCLLIELQ